MSDQQILEAVVATLSHGWTGTDDDIVPDHIRDGVIEATYYTSYTDYGTPILIRVEVARP